MTLLTTSMDDHIIVDYIFLGTKSKTKMEALRRVLKSHGIHPRRGVYRADVPSGVDESPSGEKETERGARNRAEAAFSTCRHLGPPFRGSRRLSIGIETGVKRRWGGWAEQCIAHVIMATEEDRRIVTTAGSSEFALPPRVCRGLDRGHRHHSVMEELRSRVEGKDNMALYTSGAKTRLHQFMECIENAILQLRGLLKE